MVPGLPLVQSNNNICESCIFEKHHRDKFQVGKSWRASKPLMLVHVDICGPMQISSLNGCKYFLIFVYDYSRMTWVHYLKEKFEAFSCFKQFKAVIEKKSRNSIIK